MKNSIFLSFILDEEVEVEVIMSFLKLVAWGTEIVNFWHRIISISNVNVFVEFTFIFLFYCLPIHKENRCLTRYCPSANQPTGHQMNRQGLHVPKNIFWAKFGRFWAKNPNFYQRKKKFWYSHNVCIVYWSGMAPNAPKTPRFGPKWPQMHIFGPNLFFWAKNPNFFREEAKVLVPT